MTNTEIIESLSTTAKAYAKKNGLDINAEVSRLQKIADQFTYPVEMYRVYLVDYMHAERLELVNFLFVKGWGFEKRKVNKYF